VGGFVYTQGTPPFSSVHPQLSIIAHPDADKAQKLYLDCGFTFAPGRFLPDPDIPPPDPGLLGMDFVW
jgi:hypothetical protein